MGVLLVVGCYNVTGQVTIRGYIHDENDNPFVGANIILNDTKGTVSDREGKFYFTNVLVGAYRLKVTAIGYNNFIIDGHTDTTQNWFHIKLIPQVQEMEEVKVNGNIGEKLKKSESISVQLIEEEFLKQAKASSLMQTLNSIPGINSMDIGTGISKPMIRGLSYYRVVVAQNGIKQEGQQWSNHHGIAIDQQAVSHVEIIKGPASLQYGSDAIGGVINILPLHVPITSGVTGDVSVVGKSNTKWMGGSVNMSVRKRDVYSNIALTYNNFADIKIPYTTYFRDVSQGIDFPGTHKIMLGNQLHNTAGRERAVSISTGIVKPWGNSYLELNYYGTKTGFFDWRRWNSASTRSMHEKDNRDVQFPYQQVNNYSLHHFTNRYFNKNKLEIALGYQLNDTREFDYLIDPTGNRSADRKYFEAQGNYDLGLLLHTLSANMFYTFRGFEKHEIKLGLNTQSQIHETDGYNHILPVYQRISSGIFITHKYHLSEKCILNSGARLDYTNFEMESTLHPDFEYALENGLDTLLNPYFKKKYPATAFSLGINYLPNNSTVLKANIGKSYRVPSAYELGAFGLHRHEGRFEKGSIVNKAEQAWQLDFGLEKQFDKLIISISPFINYFTNYLYLKPTSVLIKNSGQLYVYSQSQVLMTGGEASLGYLFIDRINLEAGTEYVYAVNLDLERALPSTPPFNIQSQISYLFRNTGLFSKSKAGMELLCNGTQNYTVPGELTTPGYYIINLHASTDLTLASKKVNLMLKVRNLLNRPYYNHISFYRRLRIPEPGRDFQFFICMPIN